MKWCIVRLVIILDMVSQKLYMIVNAALSKRFATYDEVILFY